jgi:hypothetical protein
MRWGWKRIDANNWRFNKTWAVSKHWATDRWYVNKDGADLLTDHATAQAAIDEAERLMDVEPSNR